MTQDEAERGWGKLKKGQPWNIPGLGTFRTRWRVPHRRRTKGGTAAVGRAGWLSFQPAAKFRDVVFGRTRP